ncbi:MAG: hypothetical protein ACFB10_06100 [Salibacteraceae bacterium]
MVLTLNGPKSLPSKKPSPTNESRNDGVSDGINDGVTSSKSVALSASETNFETLEGANRSTNDGVNEGVIAAINDGLYTAVIDPISSGMKEELVLLTQLVKEREGLNAEDLAVRRGKSKSSLERYLRIARALKIIQFEGAPRTGGYFLSPEMKKQVKS